MEKQIGNDNPALILEVERLKRQYYAMKNDRNVVPADIRKTLAKQNKLLQVLEKEKEELEVSFSRIKRNQAKNKHEQDAREVVRLLLESKQLDEQEAALSAAFKDLNKQNTMTAKKIEGIRKAQGGSELIEEAVRKEEDSDENLEKRLHTEALKYNKLMLQNDSYRQEAEDLLKERGRFQKQFEIIFKDLVTGEKIIGDLIEQNSYVYKQRKDAKTTLNALRKNAKEELLDSTIVARQLQKNKFNYTKMNKFLAQKSSIRLTTSSYKTEEEKTLKNVAAVKEMTDFFEKYGKIVTNMKNQFGEEDLARLALQFMKLEEDNFNMCSFINDRNKKLNKIRSELCRFQHTITEQKEINKNEREEHLKIIASLEKEIELKNNMAVTGKELLENTKQRVDGLLTGIAGLFFYVNCDTDGIFNKLGGNHQIRSDNVLMYLKALENRFKELQIIAGGKSEDIQDPYTMPELKLPVGPCPICAEAKYLSEVDESVFVPLTVDEYRKNLSEELEKGFRKDLLHSIEECQLPESRRILQKRKEV